MALFLSSTSDKVQVVTDASADVRVHASYADISAGVMTPDRKNATSITGSATTDVVLSPASSTVRNVKHLNIRNIHATVSVNVKIQHTDGTTIEELTKANLLPGESLVMDAGGVFTHYDVNTGPYQAQGPSDVQIFTASGANTWTKPTSFTPKIIIVKQWAAGGGGGAGASLATAVIAKGGAGGGGGAYAEATFNAADVGSTETVTIGAAGTAGVPGAAGALGGDGGAGGNTTFGTKLTAYGGGGGRGGAISGVIGTGGGGGGTGSAGAVGTTAAAVGGNPGPHNSTGVNSGTGSDSSTTVVTTHNAEYGGGAGGSGTATPTTQTGGGSLWGGGGGGQGGCHNATPAIVAGQKGGASGTYASGTGGAVGTDGASPTDGTAGADGNSIIGGGGGGGGGTTVTASTNGKAGGAGGRGGGGGGGGGVGQNPGLGGAGGLGGLGYAVIISM